MKVFIKLFFLIQFLSTLIYADDVLQKVSLQLQWKHQFQFAGYYIAKEKGYYKDVGLDVKIKEFDYDTIPVNEVINKSATYAIGRSSLIADKSKGIDIVLLSSVFQSSPLVLLATKDSNIKNVKHFIGKKIMTTADATLTASLKAMMYHHGITLKDMFEQRHSFDIYDLINGNTDLMASYISNEPFLLIQNGIEPKIFDPKDYGFDFYSDILFTSSDEIKNHKQRAVNFTSASIKGWKYAFDHIDETVELILNKYNSQNKSKESLIYEAKELKKLAYYDNKELGDIDVNKIQKIYDIYNVMGFVKNPIDIDKFIFYDKESIKFTKEELIYILQNQTVTIAMLPTYNPFSFIDNGKHQGLNIEILEKISKISGLKFDIKTSSWSNNLKKFKDAKVDMISSISHTKKREDFTLFTKPYYEIPTFIFGLKDDTHYKDFNSLVGKKVGMTKDMFYKDDLIKLGIKPIEYKDNKSKAQALAFGEIDYFLSNFVTGKKAIISQSLTNIKPIDEFMGVKKEDLRFGINKTNPILHSIIQKSLNKITYKESELLKNKWLIEFGASNNTTFKLTQTEQEYLEHKKTIKVCTNPDWTPIEFYEDNKAKGISIDMLKIIKGKINTKFEFIKTSSWSQSQEFLKQRKCDILPSAVRTTAREEYANFTKPYLQYDLAIITKNDKPLVANLKSIIKKQMVRTEGSGLILNLKEKYPNINIKEVRGHKKSFQDIVDGKAYYTIATLPVFSYFKNKYRLDDLQVAGYTKMTYNLGIAVRSDDKALLDILNKALSQISEEAHDLVYEKWANQEIVKEIDYKLIWQIVALFVLILSIIIFFLIRQNHLKAHIESLNKNLEKKVEEKNRELHILNKDFEKKD